MWSYGGYGMMGGGFLGSMVGLVVWGLIIAGVVLFARYASRTVEPRGPLASAEETLKKRYAEGEITKQQYESMLKDIAK